MRARQLHGRRRPFRQHLAENPPISIITPSNWSREGFIRSGASPEQVFVVPHGVDQSIYRPLPDDQRVAARKENNWEGFVFLSVGAMTANKGLIPLLKAFAAVASRYPDVRLVMKGIDALYRSKDMLLAHSQG
jgi:glycosyltransferase involved in cell wall biosynthesis